MQLPHPPPPEGASVPTGVVEGARHSYQNSSRKTMALPGGAHVVGQAAVQLPHRPPPPPPPGRRRSNNLAFASVRFLEESTKQAISANRTSSIAYLHLYRYRHPQSALTVKVRLLRPTPKYMAADPQRLATGADMWISTSTGFLLGQIWPPTLVRASEENKQSAML
jgi:hypothetical protein